MTKIALNSGAYQSESYIANAQRAVNVFSERNPAETEPLFPTTQYARAGLTLLMALAQPGFARCLYGATDGDLYAVIGQSVYYIDQNWTFSLLGNLIANAGTPVSMADNGKTILVVDGSPYGYTINLTNLPRVLTQIADPNFSGADRVDFLDTFLVYNIPGTNTWGCTLQGQVAFNALYVGVKTAWPDQIFSLIAVEREVFLLGPKKGEPWFNAGATPFPFQILPGVIVEQGIVAKYSLAKMDTNAFWLSESPEGARMAMRINAQNVAQRISTHAIEKIWLGYARVDDCITSVYQLAGHSFVEFHFPAADATWAYDQATDQWFQDAWIDNNGVFHRARNTFTAYAYGKNLALDWATGALYEIDLDGLTDNGQPIAWIRSFPHVANELKYLGLQEIMADVSTGTRPNTGEVTQFLSPWSAGFSSGFGPLTQVAAPTLNAARIKNGGAEFGNNRPKHMLSSGRYRTPQRWRGLGIGRDWVIELSSTKEMSGALNGAYVDPIEGAA